LTTDDATAPAGRGWPIDPVVTISTLGGVVAEYDDARGLGVIIAEGSSRGAAGAQVHVHCTAIADGSRTIEVGTAVRFVLAPGLLGRHEARDVVPVMRGL